MDQTSVSQLSEGSGASLTWGSYSDVVSSPPRPPLTWGSPAGAARRRAAAPPPARTPHPPARAQYQPALAAAPYHPGPAPPPPWAAAVAAAHLAAAAAAPAPATTPPPPTPAAAAASAASTRFADARDAALVTHAGHAAAAVAVSEALGASAGVVRRQRLAALDAERALLERAVVDAWGEVSGSSRAPLRTVSPSRSSQNVPRTPLFLF